MLGQLWYLSTIVWAWLWLGGSTLTHTLSHGELLAAAITVGAVVGTWIVYGVAIMMQSIQMDTIMVSTLVMAGMLYVRKDSIHAFLHTLTHKRSGAGRITLTDDALVWGFVSLIAIPLWHLYSIRMIPTDEHGNIITGNSCYGDLPIHMQIANSFLVGVNQKIKWGSAMMSPIFAGAPMTYPFLPDFHAAAVVSAGASMRWGFMLPGFTLACALFALIMYLGIRVTRSRMGALLGLLLTIGAGGMGGPRWYWKQGWDAMMTHDVVQHDPDGEWMMLWFAFIPHILLPQRGANFAYPMSVLVLVIMWIATDASVRLPTDVRASHLLYAACFAATLPMMQAHAFIGLGIIIFVMFVMDVHKWARDSRVLGGWVLAGVAALALSYPQMSQFTKTAAEGFGGKFTEAGWLFHNYEFGKPYGLVGFFRFWWHSLGAAWGLFCTAAALAVLECVTAHRTAARLAKDHGTGAVASHIAAVASEIGFSPAAEEAGAHERSPPRRSPPRKMPAQVPAGLHSPTVEHALIAIDTVLRPAFGRFHAGTLQRLDELCAPLNAFSVTGRAFDTIKLALGALGVFLLGNYVRMQPWDRDNAKIFYIWVFCASPLAGAILAAPFEYLAAWQPGRARFEAWFSALSCGAARMPAPSREPTSKRAAGTATPARMLCAAIAALVSPALFVASTASGAVLLHQESRGTGVLLDQHGLAMGDYIKRNVPAGAVVMHSNYHLQPSGAVAGRPSLVSYYGWVSNHGYNAGDRLRDRDYVMDNAMKDSDEQAYSILRRWGVRYIVGENIRKHARPSEQAFNDGLRRRQGDPNAALPPAFNKDLYLDGKLRRIFQAGRYELFEVLGYGFPAPSGN